VAVAVEPGAQLPLLSACQRRHPPRLVCVPLNERQRLENGIVDTSRDLGTFIGSDPLRALRVALDSELPEPRPDHQHERSGDRAGSQK
jgi:hypothetical protein